MSVSASLVRNRLPKRFPVGTTYVVEGRGGRDGHLHVLSRYVVLPGGRRIDVTIDQALLAPPRIRVGKRGHGKAQARWQGETRSVAGRKKSFRDRGTRRRS